MASLWLKLSYSLCLIVLTCIAKPNPNQETEFKCVSLYKQPGLQHPQMKNHQIQTRPSRELLSMLSTSSDGTITEIVLKGSEECPERQVPIHKPKTNLTDNLTHPQGPQHSVVRTFENTTKRWRGAQALFNINKPPQVTQNQFSKAWIWLNYIQGNSMSSIQFGWAVHTKYRDNRPRLTTFWMSEEQPKGCYNALCQGGYVQVHRSIYPGLVYDQISVAGGQQHTVHLSVSEDPVTKNWVLAIGTIMIGYWPRQSYMAAGVSEVYFGGFVGTLLSQTISPPMGNGDFPTEDLTRSCYIKQLKYVLDDYTLVDIDSNEVEEYVDNPNCYGVMFLKYVDFDSREALTFGGPGGQCII